MITGNEPITPCHLRQIGAGQDDTRIATPADLDNKSIGHYILSNKGLTIRQQFAAMAMQGLLANKTVIDTLGFSMIAEESVRQADALINELNKDK